MIRVYLAGFDVFYSNAIEVGEQLKAICEKYGLVGKFPMDNIIEVKGKTKKEIAASIFHENVSLIDTCDVVVANLNHFRGSEPDSGTSFEVGYAYAKGKSVYGYIENDASMLEQLKAQDAVVVLRSDGSYADAQNFTIEDFDLPLNLMLAISSIIVAGSAEDCLKKVSEDLIVASK